MGSDSIGLSGSNLFSMFLNLASMAFPQLQVLNSLMNMLSGAAGEAFKGGVDQLVKEGKLPSFLGEAVKTAYDEFAGANKTQTDPAADQAAQSEYGDSVQQMQQQWMQQMVQQAQQEKENQDEKAGSASGRGGWLVALAKAFGKIADKAAKELETMGKNLNSKNPSEMIEYQARSQEFAQMMNTFTNAIKTIGEANTSTVRKS